MEGKTVTVVMPERKHRELAEYAALLSAKPMRSVRTRKYRLEDALLLAAMLYIEADLYQERRDQEPRLSVASSPPG